MAKHYRKKSSSGWWLLGGIIVVVIVLFVLGRSNNANATTREVALSCTTDMFTQFHIHPHLTIAINGVRQEIPTGLGNVPGCMHPLHTHDSSGTIHVEAPEQRDFTLGDFFAVWGKTFSQDQILDAKTDATHTITETVNGTEVQTFESTVLRDSDQIVITYGSKA